MSFRLQLIDLLGGTNILRWYDFLSESQFWDKSRIENYQNEKLRFLILHCFQNVPYYKEIFHQLRLKPNDIQTVKDLYKLPSLTRKDVQQNRDKLLATNHKTFRSQKRSTGGTTGEPVKYYSDLDSWSLHWALKYRAWEKGGYRIGDKVAILGGTLVIPEEEKRLNHLVWNKLNRFYPLPTSHVNDKILARFADQILKKNIQCLRGYPSSISAFSEYCVNNNIRLEIRSVITTAEVLFDTTRELIRNVFSPVIIDTYGCGDGGGNANTCSAECGFHVSMESAVWEVCTPQGIPVNENESGELTLTSLSNFAMPLLRYQPGDLIENSFDFKTCSCGSKLPRIKRIIGKSTDILRFQNGMSLSGPAFPQLFRLFPLIQWQLVQNELNSLDVNIIPSPEYSNKDGEEILRLMKCHCGEGVEVRLNRVKEIEVPLSGKQRIIINKTLA